jgi:hypothetical protein
MEPENLDIESITDVRRAAIEQTIKPIGSDELKAIEEKLFPFFDHPWRQTFFQFLEENSGSTIYRATTNDAIEILYCAEKDIGIWFLLKGGGRSFGAPGTLDSEGDRRKAMNSLGKRIDHRFFASGR